MLRAWLAVAAAAAAPAAARPDCRTTAAPVRLPRGVVSAVSFGADPTGVGDSTAALQNAFTAARTRNWTIFLPQGCYTVRDTLNATQPRNGRWQPVVLVGQRPAAGGHRPTILLPPRTAGFGNAAAPKPVLLFTTNWCLQPGAAERDAPSDCASSYQPTDDWHSSAYQFNQLVQDVDVWLGSGNGGGVGIDMNGAQGTTLEDVSVIASDDALAGIAGGNGGGGSYKNVSVVGAKYGIDARRTGSAPTYVSVVLRNQTCAGVLQASSSTFIGTGLHIDGSPALGGVVAGIDPSVLGRDECVTPAAPFSAIPRHDAAGDSRDALHSAASLVDSVLSIGGGAPCIVANSSLYLSNVYTRRCAAAVVAGGRPPVTDQPSGGGLHFARLAFGRSTDEDAPSTTGYRYAFPSYVDGVHPRRPRTHATLAMPRNPRDGGSSRASTIALPTAVTTCACWRQVRSDYGVLAAERFEGEPPSDLGSRHWAGTGATWQSAGAVSALDTGCVGDGQKDDWAALQRAVDAHDVVVLPKGFYRLSRPLVLRRPGGALVGVGRTLSILMVGTAGGGGVGDAGSGGGGGGGFGRAPLVDVVAARVTLGFVSLMTWDHEPEAYVLRWRGAEGIWRQAWFSRMREASFPPFERPEAPRPPPSRNGTRFGQPLSIINGGGAF